MNFTQDWFTYNIPHLTELMGLLPERKRFLEIGCFEGRATCWFLEHALDDDGTMVCIDPFEGSMEHASMDLSDLYKRFQQNVYSVLKPEQHLATFTQPSAKVLRTLDLQFDFIYIDGDHTAPAVLTDACMAWPLLKKGGIMLFDDYLWGDVPALMPIAKSAPKKNAVKTFNLSIKGLRFVLTLYLPYLFRWIFQ